MYVEMGHEAKRLRLQSELDSQKTQADRNRMGQFATPTALAREMLTFGVSLLPSDAPVRFLDPGIGTGSFYSALRSIASADRIERAEGFEIDAHYCLPAQQLWAGAPLKIHLADFTTAQPPGADAERFNLVICNPPYVRHHHISREHKRRLQDAVTRVCGLRTSGLTGLYCYFLLLSHEWLAQGGVGGWLVPSEFMDVNYGKAVKRYLLNEVTLLRIHRYDPEDVQFEDALVSSAVIWLRNDKPPADHAIDFTFGGSLASPHLSRMVRSEALSRESKWTRFPVSTARPVANRITLGDLFTIKRGVATGSNDFFILSRSRIEEGGLPIECFKPILPSPRHLPQGEVAADAQQNPLVEPQLFLLECRLPEGDIRERYPALWQYLQSGKPEVAQRYLCRHRNPWYAQEHRPPAPFICTYIGRRNGANGRPFRFILNHSRATAANVYLLLYPKPLLARELAADAGLAHRIWERLNRIGPEALVAEGRVYGGGLHKLEPSELGSTPADSLLALLPQLRVSLVHQTGLFRAGEERR